MMKNIPLKKKERIDDLQINNLKIIQNTEKFCFGMDAVLLANFAAQEIKKKNLVLDLGTGTGIIPLLLWAKAQPKKIIALEIQEQMAEMAKRSVLLNGLEDTIEILQGDIKNPPKEIYPNTYDAIVTNPPYMKNISGLQNPEQSKAISRHEILCSLEDVLRTSKRLLKPRGKFYMIHRSHRLVDILSLMRELHIEPKRIRFIQPTREKAPNLVLIQGIKGSKPEVTIESPLYVYEDNGDYTQEIYDIYQWQKEK